MFTDIAILNGDVITGDGTTFHQDTQVLICRDKIVGLVDNPTANDAIEANNVIDASGCVVFPGIINAHAHGCIHGPSMPSGSPPFQDDEIVHFRNRHLLAGTTTLLNICGLALADEIDLPGSEPHPIDIRITTAHTPSNIQAALAVDGAGLTKRHLIATVDQMLSNGAVALGEAGGGQTLGGGAQEYRFIPQAIKQATGIDVSPQSARRLKNAVLGRLLNPADGVSDHDLIAVMNSCGLCGAIDAARVRDLISRSVLPSVSLALAGFDELARESARVGYPSIFHNAAPSANHLVKVAERYPKAQIVAAHSNHPSFQPEEAVVTARRLKSRGATIDVSTLDCITTRWRNDPANLDALVESGCIDTISTDFAGGHWDSILEAIHRMIIRKQLDAPKAVALATGNVAQAFPQLAGDRGFIAKGKRADVVIADKVNLSRVRDVLIAGRVVVRNSALIR